MERHGLLGDEQVGVRRREVAELGGVVGAHRVAALEPLVPHQVRVAARQHVEVDGPVSVVEEEGVVEGGGLAGELEVLGLAQRAAEDQVRQDGLLLLPPCLAVVPDQPVTLLARPEAALQRVVPAAPLLIHADGRHPLGERLRQIAVTRVSGDVEHAHQVPRDLEGVPGDAAVLLPGVGLVASPVLVEPLLHEGAVSLAGKRRHDGVGVADEQREVLGIAGREPEVDEVRGDVVADRVPVLLRPVLAELLDLADEALRVEVGEVAAVRLVSR